jgi:hypothetical protein
MWLFRTYRLLLHFAAQARADRSHFFDLFLPLQGQPFNHQRDGHIRIGIEAKHSRLDLNLLVLKALLAGRKL